jgi:hypothetical protein
VPNSPFSQSEEDIGETKSEMFIPSPPKSLVSAVQSDADSSLLPEEPVLWVLQLPRNYFIMLELKIASLKPKDQPRHKKTS